MARHGDHFSLTLITKDPALAARADAAAIDVIGIDIERLNKLERQGHIPSARISDHELDDLNRLAGAVRRAKLFARLNPVHAGTAREIDSALAGGAAVLMLPFFTSAGEVDRFVRQVDGRARIVLLLETAAAVVRLRDILAVPGFDEVMVGLNDLHLSMGVSHHFELVTSDLMSMISEAVRGSGRRFGFGGLARPQDDTLAIPSDFVIAQHARLGSTAAWISRSFFGNDPSAIDLGREVGGLRDRLSYWYEQAPAQLEKERERLRHHIASLKA